MSGRGKRFFCPPKLPDRFCDPTGGTCPWVKRQRREIVHVLPYNVMIKNEWSYKPTTAYAFVTWAGTIFITHAYFVAPDAENEGNKIF
jgi:hypothetical protein